MNFSQELGLFRSHNLCVLPEWSLCVHTQWDTAIKLWTHHPSWLTRQRGGHSLSWNAFFIDPPCLLSQSWIVGSDSNFISLYFYQKKQRFHYVGQTPSKYIHHILIPYKYFHSSVKAATRQVPAMCQHSSLAATSLLDHANPLWWQIKGPESSTQRVIWSTPAVGSSP